MSEGTDRSPPTREDARLGRDCTRVGDTATGVETLDVSRGGGTGRSRSIRTDGGRSDARRSDSGRTNDRRPDGGRTNGDTPTGGRVDGGRSRYPSRRSVLRDVAASATAIGIAGAMGVVDVGTIPDGTVEVETAVVRRDDGTDDASRAAPDLEARTMEVPADWHARVERAIAIHRHLIRARIPGYLNSAVVPGSFDDGTVRLSVGIRPDEFRSVPRDLSGLIDRIGLDIGRPLDGISIEFDDEDPVDDSPDSMDDNSLQVAPHAGLETVPGGLRCQTSIGHATVMPTLYDGDGNEFFGTAAHAVPANADQAEIRLPSVRDDDIRTIGTVIDRFDDVDVALVAPRDRVSPDSSLGVDSRRQIVGQYTRWGLATLVARDATLETIGGTTGYSSGTINGIDASTCLTTDRCRRGQVTWGHETDLEDGDSGSVTIGPPHDDLEGHLAVSVNSARTWWPGQSHVWGVAAHRLTSRRGYHF